MDKSEQKEILNSSPTKHNEEQAIEKKVNQESDKAYTPLCFAAQNGHVKMVELLLEHGADPSSAQVTAAAKRNGHIEVLELLKTFKSKFKI